MLYKMQICIGFVFIFCLFNGTQQRTYELTLPCEVDWFGCPTHQCQKMWDRCGFGIVDKSGIRPRTVLCCHSYGTHKCRICRYRSTYKREHPTFEQGNWWDQFCLPIYPKYTAW